MDEFENPKKTGITSLDSLIKIDFVLELNQQNYQKGGMLAVFTTTLIPFLIQRLSKELMYQISNTHLGN